jgi:small-conductance mechanosensitive channel
VESLLKVHRIGYCVSNIGTVNRRSSYAGRETMKLLTKRALLSAAGLLLSAGNALAASTNTSDVVGNLGPLSDLAGQILIVVKYAAIFVAILTIFILWLSGNWNKAKQKAQAQLQTQEHIKSWLVEAVLVFVGLIVLLKWIVPGINGMI